jgi:hypothetical protein
MLAGSNAEFLVGDLAAGEYVSDGSAGGVDFRGSVCASFDRLRKGGQSAERAPLCPRRRGRKRGTLVAELSIQPRTSAGGIQLINLS